MLGKLGFSVELGREGSEYLQDEKRHYRDPMSYKKNGENINL